MRDLLADLVYHKQPNIVTAWMQSPMRMKDTSNLINCLSKEQLTEESYFLDFLTPLPPKPE